MFTQRAVSVPPRHTVERGRTFPQRCIQRCAKVNFMSLQRQLTSDGHCEFSGVAKVHFCAFEAKSAAEHLTQNPAPYTPYSYTLNPQTGRTYKRVPGGPRRASHPSRGGASCSPPPVNHLLLSVKSYVFDFSGIKNHNINVSLSLIITNCAVIVVEGKGGKTDFP